ncbi:MAG: DUF192 domain-containing protein [Ignavibacteriales bacterium]
METKIDLEIANNFFSRFKGWMGKELSTGSAILIHPCASVHTCFMRQSIDVAFINKDGNVVKLIEDMQPWKFSAWIRGAAAVIEMPSGEAASAGFKEGEQIPISIVGRVLHIIS